MLQCFPFHFIGGVIRSFITVPIINTWDVVALRTTDPTRHCGVLVHRHPNRHCFTAYSWEAPAHSAWAAAQVGYKMKICTLLEIGWGRTPSLRILQFIHTLQQQGPFIHTDPLPQWEWRAECIKVCQLFDTTKGCFRASVLGCGKMLTSIETTSWWNVDNKYSRCYLGLNWPTLSTFLGTFCSGGR